MLPKNFHEFLQNEHAEDYMGTDDDMGEACDEWIANLDPATQISMLNCLEANYLTKKL